MNLIVFDFDGTLVESKEILLSNYYQYFQNTIEIEQLKKMTKWSLNDLCLWIKLEFGEIIVRDYVESIKKIYRNLVPEVNIFSTLTTIKSNGDKVAIITNGRCELVIEILRKSNLQDLVDKVVCPGHNLKPKPNSEMLARLLLRNEYEKIVLVDDEVDNFKMGIPFNTLNYHFTKNECKSMGGLMHVDIDSLDVLPKLFEKRV